MQILHDEPGYERLPYGTLIKTSDQSLDARTQRWRIGHFLTSEREPVGGIVAVRRPTSLKTKVLSVWPVVKKLFRRKVKPLFGRSS